MRPPLGSSTRSCCSRRGGLRVWGEDEADSSASRPGVSPAASLAAMWWRSVSCHDHGMLCREWEKQDAIHLPTTIRSPPTLVQGGHSGRQKRSVCRSSLPATARTGSPRIICPEGARSGLLSSTPVTPLWAHQPGHCGEGSFDVGRLALAPRSQRWLAWSGGIAQEGSTQTREGLAQCPWRGEVCVCSLVAMKMPTLAPPKKGRMEFKFERPSHCMGTPRCFVVDGRGPATVPPTKACCRLEVPLCSLAAIPG